MLVVCEEQKENWYSEGLSHHSWSLDEIVGMEEVMDVNISVM